MALSQRKRLFGTNGIRGVPGKDLTLEFIVDMGQAIGTYFSQGPLLIGYDGRRAGTIISKAIESSLMATGIDCFECGLLPTPALQYAVRRLGYKGGIMVTASHNPPQYNGIKVVGSNGVEIPREEEQKIEAIYYDRSFRLADWRSVGKFGKEGRALDTYIDGIVSKVKEEKIRSKGFKVVLDPGNGAQALAAPYVLERLGCRVFTINGHIDPDFSGRGAEPTPDVLEGLSEAVRSFGADLGVAYDGDGDRAIFADEKGSIYWGDRSGALLTDYVLSKNPRSLVVTTVSTSQLIDDIAEKYESRVIRTRVGSIDVSKAMVEKGAIFGLEENGGCFYAPHIEVRDGAMTTALMLELLSERDEPISKLFSALPSYHQKKMKLECPRESVGKVLEVVEHQAKGEVDKTDGVKLWTDEKTWILVRPSGTEPVIRIFAESDDEAKLDELVNKFSKLVGELLPYS